MSSLIFLDQQSTRIADRTEGYVLPGGGGGQVLNLAISHLGESWGRYNCTGFVYTVSYEFGYAFFDNRSSTTTQIGAFGEIGTFLLNNYLVDDPNEYLFVVPISDAGVAAADSTVDDWDLVGSSGGNVTDPGFRDFQPGDLFRGVVVGNNGKSIMHSGVVAAYDAANNTLWLVDNYIPKATYSPIAYTSYIVDQNATSRHIGSQFAVYRSEAAVDVNDNIEGHNGISNVLGGGRGRDMIYGADIADTLFGDSGNDMLYGGGGGDYLYGGIGDDEFRPGVLGYGEYEYIYGGGGKDFLNLDQSTVGLTVTLSSNSISYTNGYSYHYGFGYDIEAVIGTPFKDVIRGGTANDSISGGDGVDRITGGLGNDYISGGAGRDQLTGNAGIDRFVYRGTWEYGDVINDFVSTIDRILFRSSEVGGGGIGQLDPSRFVRGQTNQALDDNDNFIFRLTDSTLWHDSDGSGATAPVMVCDLQLGGLVSSLDIWLTA